MATGRYDNTARIGGGRFFATSTAHVRIRRAAQNGQILVREHTLKEGERLDTLAGIEYGNAQLGWVIAAASGIGWALQAPPGTLLLIPTRISQVRSLV